jgi:putative ABC transport system permease protein
MATSVSLDSWSREIRYALRGLLHRPAFTVAAVLTLALGLGATAAIFSVVNAVLLKPLPYPNADRLVALSHAAPGLGDGLVGLAQSMYFTYLDETRTLQNVGLYGNGGASVTGVGDPEQARALFVTHGVLPALGVQPVRGRPFTEADDAPAAEGPNPVIITHAYWQRKFGGDPAIIGRSMTIDARPSEIIGVMPEKFRFLNMQPEAEILLPIRPNRAQAVLGNIGGGLGLAELKPGVTLEEANADVARMLRIWLDSWPPPVGGVGRETIESGWRLAPALHPLKDLVVGPIATTLWVLMGTIAAVLLIACANIANLVLVRADARRYELAIRAALGASRARLVRVFFTESLVLGVIGGILGLAIAYAGLELLVAFGPQTLPRLQEIAIDPLVLAFVAIATLASSLFFGSIPAIKYTVYVDPRSTRGGARGATAGRETHRARNVLVVVQVALALVLIVSSGLMIRTFEALRDVDPGFTQPESIQVARIWAAPVGRPVPSEYTRLERDILERIEALPGVQSAAFGFGVPMEGRSIPNALFVEDFPQAEGEAPPTRRFKYISPGWFETLGTRMVAGRDITWTDIDNGGKVVVISEALARELWGTPDAALGKRVRETVPTSTSAWREVVGVVQDVREDSLQQAPPPLVYWPVLMEDFAGVDTFGMPAIAYAIRTERAGTASFVNEVRQSAWSVNSSLPVFLVRTMEDLYAGSLAQASFTLVMLAIAGAMALGLGVVGIAGVMAYVVSQRTREIGIRIALGAQPARVKNMFLKHGLGLAAVGILVGLAAAVALTRYMEALLFGVTPLDVPTYGVALAVILIAAALASYSPARRAATISPAETLKSE